jgi:cell division protein YceG involved in septum cleavage
VKRFIAVIVILAGLGYGGARGSDWYNWQVNTPVSNKNEPVIVRVTPGEGYNDVADELESRHLIRNRDVFIAYAKYTGARGTLQAGDIVLNRNMNMRQIIERLGELQPVEQIAITVPEGLTVQKTAELVEQRGIGKATDYLAAVKDTTWTQDFLAGRLGRTCSRDTSTRRPTHSTKGRGQRRSSSCSWTSSAGPSAPSCARRPVQPRPPDRRRAWTTS